MPCTCVRANVVTRLDRAKYISYSFGNDVHARVHAVAQVRSTLIDTHAFLVRSLSVDTAEAPFPYLVYRVHNIGLFEIFSRK